MYIQIINKYFTMEKIYSWGKIKNIKNKIIFIVFLIIYPDSDIYFELYVILTK